jgi:hypothetical protein
MVLSKTVTLDNIEISLRKLAEVVGSNLT